MSRSFSGTSLITATADEEIAGADVLEPRDHPEGRRLPAAGRPDEHEQLRLCDLEREVLHGLEAVGEAFVQVIQDDLGHGWLPLE